MMSRGMAAYIPEKYNFEEEDHDSKMNGGS